MDAEKKTRQNAGEVILEAKDLTAGYGTNVILKNLSFGIRQGEILALLGGSGCGKSTLMQTLIGLIPPLAGEVSLGGEVFATPQWQATEEGSPLLHHLGVMFQGGALFGSQTLLENVTLPLREFTDYSPAIMERIARLKLGLVGLAPFADYFPREISGGMQKRAAIARAMALDPEILFLDEPSAGLDPVTSASLDDLILRIREESGTTVVLVSHELPSINRVADRVLFLDRSIRGLLDEGSPEQLREHSAHSRVRAFFNRTAESAEKESDPHDA